jgi:hypothetical protein
MMRSNRLHYQSLFLELKSFSDRGCFECAKSRTAAGYIENIRYNEIMTRHEYRVLDIGMT